MGELTKEYRIQVSDTAMSPVFWVNRTGELCALPRNSEEVAFPRTDILITNHFYIFAPLNVNLINGTL